MADYYAVQFLHPGGEHQPNEDGLIAWNTGAHRRKFLKTKGAVIDAERIVDEEIVFWGEWEPPSRLIRSIPSPLPHGPRNVFEPYLERPQAYDGPALLQNTDPFVFGPHFHYTGCQQRTKRGPTRLRYLERGSLVLFGSCVERRMFALDTVFVVGSWIDHDRLTFTDAILDHVHPTYVATTFSPWYRADMMAHDPSRVQTETSLPSFRLYCGASPGEPVEGMYSFFPCQQYAQSPFGFERPIVSLPGVVNPQKTQGYKLTPLNRCIDVSGVWQAVVDQVLNQGCRLGVKAELPPVISPR